MTKPCADMQMAELTVFVHGVLAALHFLGVVYNRRRRNHIETAAHAAACAFDVWAVTKDAHRLAALRTHAPD
jgi:hypothetical protein